MKDLRTPEQVKGQDGACATVKVKADNPDGYAVIDAHAFDPAVHEEFGAVVEKKKK
jgi:hypothetical protein